MGILNPLNLLYLLSIGVLVALYVRARSRPTIEVSSLMLFDEVPAPVASVRRLNVDLLFWLELLALSALSLAAAGLYLRMPAQAARIRHHALVFDVAASMGARDQGGATRLAEAEHEALRTVTAAPAGETFSVIAYAREARVMRAPSANRRAIRAAIARLRPLDVAVRPAALAAALIAAREADTIGLYADRLPPGDVLNASGAGARLHLHPIGVPADNLAIVSLDPGEAKARRGACVLRNFSTRPHLCQLEIEAAGATVLRTAVMLEPRGLATVPFGPLTQGGLVRARLSADDALAADNQRWAWAQSDAAEKVLLVSPDAAVRDDLARVLLAVNQNFTITALDPKNLKPADRSGDFALAVMHDFYDPNIKAASRLLIFPPADSRLALAGPASVAELREPAGQGALAQPVVLSAARVLTLPSWMDVLATGALADHPGAALAAYGRDRNGALGVLGFDVRDHLLLDPDRLEALVLTVDLMKRLLAPENVRVVSTGAYVTIPVAGAARVIAPDGRSRALRADRFGCIRFQATLAGHYRITSAGRSVEIYANYFDAAESDLSAPPPSAPAAKAASGGAAPMLNASAIRSLEVLFLALALLAFLAESAIILSRAAGWKWRHV